MTRIILAIATCVILSFLFSSCVTMVRAHKAQSVCRNVAYGPKLAQRLDVYFPPEGAERSGVAIALHGGGWMTGSKEDMADCGRLLASAGFVTVSANYRLALNIGFREPTIADMLDDIDSIKNFVREREAEWNCDSSRLALIGFSAGAHLSLMEAMTRNDDGRIRACVSISGVSDLTDPAFHKNTIGILKARLVVGIATGTAWDGDNDDTVALYETLSPINHAKGANCPVVIAHGTNDRIVPVAQARSLAELLRSLGKDVTYVEGPVLDHELEDEEFRATFANETLLPILRRTISNP